MWVLALSFHHVGSETKPRTLGLVTGEFTYGAISLALNFILKGFIKGVPAAPYFLSFSQWSNKKQPSDKDGVYNCKRAAENAKEFIIVAVVHTHAYEPPGFSAVYVTYLPRSH